MDALGGPISNYQSHNQSPLIPEIYLGKHENLTNNSQQHPVSNLSNNTQMVMGVMGLSNGSQSRITNSGNNSRTSNQQLINM